MERVKGIEPSWSAWEADVLPLNYTRGADLDNNYSKNRFSIHLKDYALPQCTSIIRKRIDDVKYSASSNFCATFFVDPLKFLTNASEVNI